ncbi:tRNA dimethylallyltransferase [Bacteroidia bacterium]|nr:tRNA dimethylallyltransferase [Bacteroidia bacterium]
MTPTTFIITGPTASGKSWLAHELAKRINGAVINCDAVQLYNGIETLSASPLTNNRQPATNNLIDDVSYFLYSTQNLSEHISAGQYCELAKKSVNAAINSGMTPILCGGTGFYIDALLRGFSPLPEVSESARVRARSLAENNPNAAQEILGDFKFSDPQRIARALEVFLETGLPIEHFQSMDRSNHIVPNAIKILVNPAVEILTTRMQKRINDMFNDGAIDEVKNMILQKADLNRAIGANEIAKFLKNEIGRDECLELWLIKTRQYAKRQRTWFKNKLKPDIIIDHIPTISDIETILSYS